MGALVLLTLFLCIFGWPLITLLPVYTDAQLGRSVQTYSLLVSALGGGALVAALATATFGTTARRGFFLAAGAVAGSIGLLGVSQTMRPGLAALACAASGFGLILYLSTAQSTLQMAVPDSRRGRVLALWAMTLSASAPLGHLLAGQAVTLVGVGRVLLIMAAGAGLVAIGISVLVSLREFR
jgi:hypothetical protein